MKQGKIELSVGIFTILGLALFCFAVFFVSDILIFKSGYEVNTKFNYIGIIDKGAPVRMSGVRVGEVREVKMYYEEKTQKPTVILTLFVNSDVIIRENTLITIRGTTPLSEPHIEILSEGLVDGMPLEKGSTIRGEDPISMDEVVITSERVAENLEAILADVRAGKGTAGELLVGDELYKEILAFVKDIRKNPWKLLARPKKKKRFLFF